KHALAARVVVLLVLEQALDLGGGFARGVLRRRLVGAALHGGAERELDLLLGRVARQRGGRLARRRARRQLLGLAREEAVGHALGSRAAVRVGLARFGLAVA